MKKNRQDENSIKEGLLLDFRVVRYRDYANNCMAQRDSMLYAWSCKSSTILRWVLLRISYLESSFPLALHHCCTVELPQISRPAGWSTPNSTDPRPATTSQPPPPPHPKPPTQLCVPADDDTALRLAPRNVTSRARYIIICTRQSKYDTTVAQLG